MLIASLFSVAVTAASTASALPSSALTVTTESTAPASLPKGATRVPLLSVDMQASCDSDIQVSSLTLAHTGIGNAQDIRNVYALSDKQRVTRSGHMDADGMATIRFLRPLTLRACSRESFVIAADFTAEAASGGGHALTIRSKESIQTTAGEVTLRPAATTGNTAAIAGTGVGTVTVQYLPVRGTIRYGATETLARLQLSAGGRTDSALKSITLTNEGTARDTNFSDLHLETSAGETVTTTAAHLTGNTVHLTFTPDYVLRRGDIKTLVLKGRVSGSTLRTVQFLIEETADLETADVHLR